MGRTRKKAETVNEAEAATQDVFDEAIAAQATPTDQAQTIVEQVVDSTRMPVDQPRQAIERRQFPRPADPFGIATDVIAGVRLLESRRFGKMLLAFEEKPSGDVIAKLRDADFRWEPHEKVWARPLGDSPLSTRIKAEDTYREVAKMVREERGIGHDHGIG